MSQPVLFYEDIYDAVNRQIAESGKNRSCLALVIYPGAKPETAVSKLTRALSPENTDVSLTVEMMRVIMKECGANHIINYLCDDYGYDRTHRKDPEDFKRQIQGQIKGVEAMMKDLLSKVSQLEGAR
jgi:hypothetical protein